MAHRNDRLGFDGILALAALLAGCNDSSRVYDSEEGDDSSLGGAAGASGGTSANVGVAGTPAMGGATAVAGQSTAVPTTSIAGASGASSNDGFAGASAVGGITGTAASGGSSGTAAVGGTSSTQAVGGTTGTQTVGGSAGIPVSVSTAGAAGGTTTLLVEDPVLAALPDWAQPPKETTVETTVLEASTQTSQACKVTKHDVRRNYEDITARGDVYADLKPGMVLQGNSVKDGTMAPVPLARAPIQISINLAVTNSTRTIQNPTSANIQQAVSELQREADARLGNLPAIPSQIDFKSAEVQSMVQAALEVQVAASYSGALFKGSLDSTFSASQSTSTYTVVSKLTQPMYTISISDDQLPTARSFFADSLTTADFAAQERLGTLGPNNIPTYVKSVTFGRMVIFTLTSSTVKSSMDLRLAVEASYGKFNGKGSVSAEQQKTLNESTMKVLVLGGDQADATEAIRTGDYSLFFTAATATTAVPLSYRINSLVGSRKPAAISDMLSYVTTECPLGANGQKCYLSKYGGVNPYVFCQEPLTHAAAAKKCADLGLHLLRVPDYTVDRWVNSQAKYFTLPSNYWLRARRWPADATVWTWDLDVYDPVPIGQPFWGVGEPSAVASGGGDCAIVTLDKPWSDANCNDFETVGYVCSE